MKTVNQLLDLNDAKDLPDLVKQAVGIANSMEFEFCSFSVITERDAQTAFIQSGGNVPAKMHSEWSRPRKNDPVIRKLKQSNLPFVYDESTFVLPADREYYEIIAPFGFKTGICVPLHLGGGKHFVFGFDRSEALPVDQSKLVRMLADVQLVATYAQQAASRTVANQSTSSVAGAPQLSKRERDVLAWTAEGKTNGVVAQILQVSEHTVKCHVRSAMVKLDVSSRHRAAAKALSLGLLR